MDKIQQLRQLIADADYVLIGAGAGLSAAAGLDYAGEDFRQEFARPKKNCGPSGPSTSGLPAIGQRPCRSIVSCSM